MYIHKNIHKANKERFLRNNFNSIKLKTMQPKSRDENNRRFLFIDMDGVIADFNGAFPDPTNVPSSPKEMFTEGFFANLEPIKGSVESIERLVSSEKFNIQILSKPLYNYSNTYAEKVFWITKHFPFLQKHITLTQSKQLLSGPSRILIDDCKKMWEKPWIENGGTFIHFNIKHKNSTNGYDCTVAQWDRIVSQLLSM